MNVVRHEVSFPAAGGMTIAGHLRVPDGAGPAPGLVFTGPFTGVKEQVTGHYADLLAARGFVTLAFDHRNFGASSGQPRQHEDAAGKHLDLLAATTAIAAHPAVDPQRLGAVGICLGGSYAVRHAAFDPRIRAVALVAGGFNDPTAFRSGMGVEGYQATLAGLLDVAAREQAGGTVEYVPAVDGEGGEAAMPGDEPFAYYGTERSASGLGDAQKSRTSWENRVTRMSIYELLTLDAVSAAALIAPRPALVVHGRRDDYCTPENAEHLYDRLGDPKRLVWLDTSNHIDLYDNPRYVEPAVDEVATWFCDRLRSSA